MTFTIEQLEALKEGITPGLWGVSQWEDTNRKDAEIFQYDGEFLPRIGVALLKDAHAIAAVPELLDQLIAREKDLQEILERIKWVRDHYTWWIDPELRKQPFLGRIPTEANIYDALTQILEGNQ